MTLTKPILRKVAPLLQDLGYAQSVTKNLIYLEIHFMTKQTNITVREVEELIDRLSDKTLSFGCKVEGQDENGYNRNGIIDVNCTKDAIDSTDRNVQLLFHITKILGHSVMLGTVLAKMQELDSETDWIGENALMGKWRECNFKSSLQDILEGAEKEPIPDQIIPVSILPSGGGDIVGVAQEDTKYQLTPNTPAANLFQFIINLGL